MSLGIDDNDEGADIWWNTTASAKDYFLSDSVAPNQTQAVSVCACVRACEREREIPHVRLCS